MKPQQVQNSKEWPKPYSCRFMEPGLVSYEDSDCGIARLTKETIQAMLPSFVGRPVCVDHHKITPENYEELKKNGTIVGNVLRAWFNPDDGWFWADFIVDTEEGRRCIDEKNYSVSCAYNVISVQGGGLWHDIKYDGEITDGSFTHLALVEQPRYEESKITDPFPAMLVNGKVGHRIVEVNKTQEAKMDLGKWKFWEKKENSKEKTAELASMHVEISGKTLPLGEVLNAVEKAGLFEERSNDKPKTMMCAKGDIVDIEGHTYPIAELVNAYQKMNSTDESEEDKKAREAKEKEVEAKNAKEAEDKEKAAAEEKENAKKVKEAEELANAKAGGKKSFDEVENAGGKAADEGGQTTVPLTRSERASRWHDKNKKK